MHFKHKILNNNLEVIVNEDRMTRLSSVNILYKVGSKNENENHTGLAHLFEHLMFAGSKNFPDFDLLINNLSGTNNAFTTADYTNFYMTLPSDYTDYAIDIEKDRMINLLLDKEHLSIQKKVVIEEFKQRFLNQPYGDLYKILRELCYKIHPYRWQTIGKNISHIEGVDLDIAKEFYNKFYAPNNAIMAISGNVVADEVIDKCEKVFGQLPYKDMDLSIPKESLQTEDRFMEVKRSVPSDVLVIAFPIPNRVDKRFYAIDLLSDILSNGRSSRLYNSLVLDKKIFTSIDAVLSGDDDEGLFMVIGMVSDDVDIKRAEEYVWKELMDIISNPPKEREFQKVKNKNAADFMFNNVKIADKALSLAYYAHLNILDRINKENEYYDSVTIDDIIKEAQNIFVNGKHNTLYYRNDKK